MVLGLRRKLEYGDLLLPFYILVFIRQYLWALESQIFAWGLSCILTVVLWFVHLRYKPDTGEKTPASFWLLVALPLLVIYGMRAAIPDLSYDVLNHRLIQAERALRGPQLLPGDFFPTIFPFNPSADMLTGISRYLLGYRLGTIVNYLAFVWVGLIVEKIVRPILPSPRLRAMAVLLILFTEHSLFQINNYMVDILALPLMLEALRLALLYDESKHKRRDVLFSALLAGGAAALKFTNVTSLIPIAVIFASRILSGGINRAKAALILLACLCFAVPLLPHGYYIFGETGSPVFPLYNNLIKSPFWPDLSPYDARWGPHNLIETLLWPLISVLVPQRLSELGVYAGRLTIGFFAAALSVFLPRVNTQVRLLGFFVLSGSLIWSITSGYIRYALMFEILGGVLLLYLAYYLSRNLNANSRLKTVGIAVPLCLLLAQCLVSAKYVWKTEWSQRPNIFVDHKATATEIRWLFRDRNLMKFQPRDSQLLLGQLDAWIVSGVKSNGVQALLHPNVPALAVNNLEYFDKPASRERFARAVESLKNRRVYSLTLIDELESSLEFLKRRRLNVGEMKPVVLRFFSDRTRLHMMLIETIPAEPKQPTRKKPGDPLITSAHEALDDDGFRAQLSVAEFPTSMKRGETATIRVVIKNLSNYVWPSRGDEDSRYLINVANTWLTADRESLVNNMDGRASLPVDLWPEESIQVLLEITAPQRTGEFLLEVDLVQEGVAFFKDKGSSTWRTRIRVE